MAPTAHRSTATNANRWIPQNCGRNPDLAEALGLLGLLAGERTQSLGAVDGLLDRPSERGRGLLPVLVGKQEARRVGVPAAAGHPNPSGAQR
jgi:hypothetical protein